MSEADAVTTIKVVGGQVAEEELVALVAVLDLTGRRALPHSGGRDGRSAAAVGWRGPQSPES